MELKIGRRLKQFREYNKLQPSQLAEILEIETELYNNYEKDVEDAPYDVIEALSIFYKVTVDEFYGYTPRLSLHTESDIFPDDDDDNNVVDEAILKMSDLSWDEAKLINLYRNSSDKDSIIQALLAKEDK